MNKQLKAKLKYLFFHFPPGSPDTFVFEGVVYRIVDKKKLKKGTVPLVYVFIFSMLVLTHGISIFQDIFYIFLFLLGVCFVVCDWIRLPKDIFPYLEKIETK